NPLSHEPEDFSPGSASASRFSPSGAKLVATAAWIGAVVGARTSRAGLGSRCGFAFGSDPTNLPGLCPWRATRASDPGLPSQPDGSARPGGALQPDSFPVERCGNRGTGRVGTVWGL